MNLKSLHSRMLCAKVGWNWPNSSGEKDFKISSMQCIFTIIYYPPLKRAGPFIWTNLNSLHRGYIVSGLVEFGPIKAYVFDNVEEWQRTIILTETKISKNDTWASLYYIFCALIQYHWLLIVSPTVKIKSI